MDDSATLESLLDVQGVDSEIDRLLARRAGLPLLDTYKEVHSNLTALEAELATQQARARELRLALDRAEGEMGLDEEKLQQEERRLYAGGLSARDATHLRDEVAMLRKRISEREDEVLVVMEQREEADAEVAQLDEKRAELDADKQRIEAEIGVEWKVIDEEVATLRSQRDEMTAGIDDELLELYDGIRESQDGVGIAVLASRVCSGCHLALSAAEEVQALKGDPPRCLHCRRIIVPR